MAKDEPDLRRLVRAAQRAGKAEGQLEQARLELYAEIRKAHAQGASLSAMARELGVSRQRMQKLMQRIGE
jgi:2-keto-3-deoxy-L-rhamnonate aldolase RhmA